MKKPSRVKKIAIVCCLTAAALAVLCWVSTYVTARAIALSAGGQTWFVLRSSGGDLDIAQITAQAGKRIDSATAKESPEHVLVTQHYHGEIGSFLGFALYDQTVPKSDPTASPEPFLLSDQKGPPKTVPLVSGASSSLYARGVGWIGVFVMPWWFVVLAMLAWPVAVWVAKQMKEDKGPRRKRWLRNQAISQPPS